jgi:hypothetical protein
MVQVVRTLRGKQRFYLDVELEHNELAALGRLTAQWSHLEHLIYINSQALAELNGIDPPSEVTSKSFSNRLAAFRQLILSGFEGAQKTKYEKLLSKIANIEQDRHKLIHGTWDWLPTDPSRIIAKCDRPNVEFEKPFDFETIYELGTRIGEISFELAFPSGYDTSLEERTKSGFAVSRLGMKMLMGKTEQPKSD